MALSYYYSNWDTFQQELIEEAKLPPELYNDGFTLPADDSYFDVAQFLELEPQPDNLFSSENYIINSLPPNYLSTTPHNNNYYLNHFPSPPDLTFQVNPQEFHFQPSFHTQKRQKLVNDYEQLIYSDNQLVNYGSTNHQLQSGFCMPDVTTLPGISTENKQQQQPIRLSAQSIAARQRRRKISEKTQELGKLIPGAHKLNTAEMFQAAYKYIKYLQAQVGILEFMASNHQEGELIKSEEMHGLLESSLVQEKLYAAEKCMVPRIFLQELAGDDQKLIKSHVLKEVKELNQ